MDDLIKEIRSLEDNGSYFGRILSLSVQENITEAQAWQKIEERRKELGLNPKFSTEGSFRKTKSNFLNKGDLIRFDFD